MSTYEPTTDATASPTFRRIVVGYDGSDAAEDAVALARELAAPNTEVVLVCGHPYQPLSARTRAGDHEVPARNEAMRVLERGRERLRRPDARLEAPPAIDGAHALAGAAADFEADVVVVGSARRAGSVLAKLGTTADALLRRSPAPVLVAPAGWREREPGGPRTIGVAVDDGDEAAAALRLALALALRSRASLRVMHVAASPRADGPDIDLRHRLAPATGGWYPVDTTVEVVVGDPAERLHARSGELDLLVVGSHGRGAVGRLVLGTVAGAVIRDASCPVLAVGPRAVGHVDDLAWPPVADREEAAR